MIEKTIFMAVTSVGVLEQQVQAMNMLNLKRKRQSEFRQIEAVLKGLRLVDRASSIKYIGWGVSQGGEVGLVVTLEFENQIRGFPLPEGESK